MTDKEAHAYIERRVAEGVTSGFVVIEPKVEKQKRVEKDGIISFRVARSVKVALYDLLERIGARIGTQRKEDCLDWLISEVNTGLDNEDDHARQ